jgi:hypothetical protein
LFWWFRVVLLHQLVRWCQYNVTSRPYYATVSVGVKQNPKQQQQQQITKLVGLGTGYTNPKMYLFIYIYFFN